MDSPEMRRLYEEQFWAGVSSDALAVASMAAGVMPIPPDFKDRIERQYRITFKCKSCPNDHTITGPFKGMVEATMVLTARGIDEILIQEEAFAMEQDAEVADDALEEQGLDPSINQRLHDQFFTRKP